MSSPRQTDKQTAKPDSQPKRSMMLMAKFVAKYFRNFISSDPSAPFPAQKDRYVLYIQRGCPWAHRANIVRSLKGLEDIIQLSHVGDRDPANPDWGWSYDGAPGVDEKDPLYGFKYLRDLYLKADPNYKARYTVPMLWDKVNETVVNNESSEIIRSFYTAFDDLLPARLQEANKPDGGLLPKHLEKEIDEMNSWVYDTINNGVYKAGFAGNQKVYEEHVYPIFESLQRVEDHLQSRGTPYLFGEDITEADIRLYPSIARFDVAYNPIFKCNLKMIRHDFPRIHDWLRRLYWDESEKTNGGAFRKTTYFTPVSIPVPNLVISA
ncbi:MAG: hypothetical protein M1822_001174 [Bathelium mastoideum]|nr:MAG: hypothetical protein M1822_001174 [Bathelium mastoideum]